MTAQELSDLVDVVLEDDGRVIVLGVPFASVGEASDAVLVAYRRSRNEPQRDKFRRVLGALGDLVLAGVR